MYAIHTDLTEEEEMETFEDVDLIEVEATPKPSGLTQVENLLEREQKLTHLAGKMRSLLAEIEEVLR